MIGIDKPSIEALDLSEDGTYGKFVMEPLERGYGTTIGNSRPFPVLRRMSRRLFLILRALSSRYTATVLRLSI